MSLANVRLATTLACAGCVHAFLSLVVALVPAAAQTAVEPVEVWRNETHRLSLVTRMNADNCTASGALVWAPGPDNPVYPLVVGDAYRVEVTVLSRGRSVLIWKGLWEWKASQKCGKNDTCVTPYSRPVEGLSGFTLGDTAKLIIVEGMTTTSVAESTTINNYTDSRQQLIFRHSFSQFVPPENSRPHPSAVLTKNLCATVLVPKVDIADVRITVLRRRR